METILAEEIIAIITDENDSAFFVQKNGKTYCLPKSDSTNLLSIGDSVKGFVYENSSKKLMMTTTIPSVTKEKYGWATVKQVRKDLGVFLDIGLADKEMVLSLDELPSIHSLWPKKGNQLYVRLLQDKKDRIWATLASPQEIKAMTCRGSRQLLNKDIQARVFSLRLIGTHLISDEGYLCFLHPSERLYEPTLGELVSVRVIGVRDGVLNVSMRPRAHEAISEDAMMILTMLENYPGQVLPYGDKSDAAEIKKMFGISKGQFKRAVGHLLKAKKIKQEENCLILLEGELNETKEIHDTTNITTGQE